MASSETAAVAALRKILTDETALLAHRFRALFSLKHLASQPPSIESSAAIKAIAAGFVSPSALLKHELAYCLGQTRNLEAVPYLTLVLKDKLEDPMCRHEAAEALGALGDSGSIHLLEQLKSDPSEPVVVRETCDIALDRLQWSQSENDMHETLKKR